VVCVIDKGETTVTRQTGKVAFITGIARGQGRSHALRLAEEGADIIGVDICADIPSVTYPMASEDDLAETVKGVEGLGRKIVASVADVRNHEGLQRAFDKGVDELGPVDIVIANAGVWSIESDPKLRQQAWQDSIDIMVTGAFNTLDVAVPSMVDRNAGGSIVIVSSTAGLKAAIRNYSVATGGRLAYTTAKHAVVGLMRGYANILAEYSIRVNTIHPTGVNTVMIMNESFARHAKEQPADASSFQNALPIGVLEPADVSNAVAWLCSDEAKYITGTTFVVDAGFTGR
jgi:SDR family mycofactocin-dependent oxidoreductase